MKTQTKYDVLCVLLCLLYPTGGQFTIEVTTLSEVSSQGSGISLCASTSPNTTLTTTRSLLECGAMCADNDSCVALNYKNATMQKYPVCEQYMRIPENYAIKPDCLSYQKTDETTEEIFFNVNECLSDPCFNNATCVDRQDSYRCACAPGYTGIHCQTDINECLSTQCYNNGTCVDGVNSYRCQCVPGYTGVHCQTDINECLSSPCVNNGTCFNGLNNFACKCVPGYTGIHCETDIDECLSGPCLNNGTCVDGLNNYTCGCGLGYTGIHCQTDIDDCLSQPCGNSGRCVDGQNSYRCQCNTGYTGTHCETVLPTSQVQSTTTDMMNVTTP